MFSTGGCPHPGRACARGSPTIASGWPSRVATYIEIDRRRGDAGRDRALPGRPAAAAREHDAFFQPMVSRRDRRRCSSTARAGSTSAVALTGAHGLPLMGTGDWNDGMNRVGEAGRGESVWLGWLLLQHDRPVRPAGARRAATRTRRRAGAPMPPRCEPRWSGRPGTATGTGAPPSTTGRRSARRRTRSAGSTRSRSPGRCCRARPTRPRRDGDGGGRRASDPAGRAAGPAVHAALRQDAARPRLHQGLSAGHARERRPIQPRRHVGDHGFREARPGRPRRRELFALLNPINHARTPADVGALQGRALCRRGRCLLASRRMSGAAAGPGTRVRPAGCTGPASKGSSGIRQRGEVLRSDPCIPSDWPGFQVTLRRGTTRYDVSVENPAGCCQGIGQAELDGVGMDLAGGLLVVPLDGGIHRLRIVLERAALAAA